MTTRIESRYECQHCSKNYKIKSAYERHILVCSIVSKTPKERKLENEEYENMPNLRELYQMVQILILKNEKLEKQVDKMSAWINNKKRVNVLEWLNENNKPSIQFNEWIETLVITKVHMKYVFEHNFVEGVNLIVREIININLDSLPIKSFEQRENILYVYNGDENKWEIIDANQTEMLFVKITKGLLNQFKFWQDKNKHRLCNGGFTEKYIENVKKITGGDLSKEQQCCKLKQSFYNALKVNIKNIIQYEFVF